MIIQTIFLLLITYAPSSDQKGLEISGFNENGTQIGYRESGVFTKFEWVTINSGIIGLENEMFMDSSSLRKIILADTLKYIGSKCFMNCPIEDLKIPEGIEYILEDSLRSCSSLKTLELPSKLKSIQGSHTFLSTTSMKYFISNGEVFTTVDEGRILVKGVLPFKYVIFMNAPEVFLSPSLSKCQNSVTRLTR